MCAVIKRLRAVVLILAAVFGLSACANSPVPYTSSPGISGSQRALRSESSRFNETVALPAVIGAFSGALLGGLLCDKKNRAACVGGGAAAGALLGGGAGYLVAVQNRKFANREEELRARTSAARKEVERFDRIIAAINDVISEHRREIALLGQRSRTGQASRSDYQKQLAGLSGDIKALRVSISASQKNIDAINGDLQRLGRNGTSGLTAERDELLRQKKILEQQLAELTRLSEGVPTS